MSLKPWICTNDPCKPGECERCAHDWRDDGRDPHRDEYWYKCARCGASDWIASYGTKDQLRPRVCKPPSDAPAVAAPAGRSFTLLLVGPELGLVGKPGETFLAAPDHYERVNVYEQSQPAAQPLTPLTAEQIERIAAGVARDDMIHDFARAIERAHGIKGDA